MREFNLHVSLQIGKRADFYHPANRVLTRFQVSHYQHLADADCGGHSYYRALRKHDHRAGLFFEGFGVRRNFAHNFRNARAVNLHGNFQRDSIGARVSRLLCLRRSAAFQSVRISRGICDFRCVLR